MKYYYLPRLLSLLFFIILPGKVEAINEYLYFGKRIKKISETHIRFSQEKEILKIAFSKQLPAYPRKITFLNSNRLNAIKKGETTLLDIPADYIILPKRGQIVKIKKKTEPFIITIFDDYYKNLYLAGPYDLTKKSRPTPIADKNNQKISISYQNSLHQKFMTNAAVPQIALQCYVYGFQDILSNSQILVKLIKIKNINSSPASNCIFKVAAARSNQNHSYLKFEYRDTALKRETFYSYFFEFYTNQNSKSHTLKTRFARSDLLHFFYPENFIKAKPLTKKTMTNVAYFKKIPWLHTNLHNPIPTNQNRYVSAKTAAFPEPLLPPLLKMFCEGINPEMAISGFYSNTKSKDPETALENALYLCAISIEFPNFFRQNKYDKKHLPLPPAEKFLKKILTNKVDFPWRSDAYYYLLKFYKKNHNRNAFRLLRQTALKHITRYDRFFDIRTCSFEKLKTAVYLLGDI